MSYRRNMPLISINMQVAALRKNQGEIQYDPAALTNDQLNNSIMKLQDWINGFKLALDTVHVQRTDEILKYPDPSKYGSDIVSHEEQRKFRRLLSALAVAAGTEFYRLGVDGDEDIVEEIYSSNTNFINDKEQMDKAIAHFAEKGIEFEVVGKFPVMRFKARHSYIEHKILEGSFLDMPWYKAPVYRDYKLNPKS